MLEKNSLLSKSIYNYESNLEKYNDRFLMLHDSLRIMELKSIKDKVLYCFKYDCWTNEVRKKADSYILNYCDAILDGEEKTKEQEKEFIEITVCRYIDKLGYTQNIKTIEDVKVDELGSSEENQKDILNQIPIARFKTGKSCFIDNNTNQKDILGINYNAFRELNPKEKIVNLVCSMYHEIKHGKQSDCVLNNKVDYKDIYLHKEAVFMNTYYPFYNEYASSFLFEKDAYEAEKVYGKDDEIINHYGLKGYVDCQQPIMYDYICNISNNEVSFQQFINFYFDCDFKRILDMNGGEVISIFSLECRDNGEKKTLKELREGFKQEDGMYSFGKEHKYIYSLEEKQKLCDDIIENDLFYNLQFHLEKLAVLKGNEKEYNAELLNLANKYCINENLYKDSIFLLEKQRYSQLVSEENKKYIDDISASFIEVQKKHMKAFRSGNIYRQKAEINYMLKEHEIARTGFNSFHSIQDRTFRELIKNISDEDFNIYAEKYMDIFLDNVLDYSKRYEFLDFTNLEDFKEIIDKAYFESEKVDLKNQDFEIAYDNLRIAASSIEKKVHSCLSPKIYNYILNKMVDDRRSDLFENIKFERKNSQIKSSEKERAY